VRFGLSESNSNGTVATPVVRWFRSVLRIMVAVVTKLRELPGESTRDSDRGNSEPLPREKRRLWGRVSKIE